MVDIKNELVWSQSRINHFKNCERSYYYQYYGSWGGWLDNASKDQKELYLLKNLETVQIYVGSKVHEIIQQTLQAKMNGKEISIHEAIAMFTNFFEKQIQLSKNHYYCRKPNIHGFIEDEYNLELKQKDIDDAKSAGISCIKNFFRSKILSNIMSTSAKDWFFNVSFQKYTVLGEEVFALFDFAYVVNNKLVILDFKTGKRNDSEIDFQSKAYTHFFMKEKGFSPENITFTYWYLSDDSTKTIKYTQKDMLKFEADIQKQMQELRSKLVNVANNTSQESSFPKTKEIVYCRHCKFRRYCKKRN